MKLFPFLIGILTFTSFTVKAQGNWKVGFYDTVKGFNEQTPTVGCSFEAKPKSFLFKDSLELPDIYKLIPKETAIPYAHFKHNSILAWDGESLFLNLNLLRMSSHFVKIRQPDTYLFFIGREQAPVDWGMGSSYWASQENGETDMNAHKPYLFDINSGRLHSLIPSTLERLLEPYPDVLNLYSKDPERETQETMKVYLEILNEMIKTENPQ